MKSKQVAFDYLFFPGKAVKLFGDLIFNLMILVLISLCQTHYKEPRTLTCQGELPQQPALRGKVNMLTSQPP